MTTSNTIIDRSSFNRGGRTGILLIHGLGGTPVELRSVETGLVRAGYTVYCCQLAGHCGTPDELRSSTWQQWHESVEAAHERLLQSCDIVVAGGLSMGAILALHLAHKRPHQVHGLVLLAPTLRLDGWSMPWYSPILRLLRPLPFTLNINLAEREPYGIKDERVRALVVKSMLSGDAGQAGVFSTPARCFGQFNQLVSEVRRELPRISAPALIIHPREDDIASLGNALEIQRKLAGMVEMVVLDDSYHIITLDRQRHIVVERTLSFTDHVERHVIKSRERDAITAPRRRARGAE